MYTPASAKDWKESVKRGLERSGWDGQLLNGAVVIDLTFQFARPQRLLRKKDTDERIPHIVRPDKDNLEKAVLDALEDAGLYPDDCRVYSGETSKHYVSRIGSFTDEGVRVQVYEK